MQALQIDVPAKVSAVALLRSLADQMEQAPAIALATARVPRIGTDWDGQNGIYAGMARGEAADYPLVVGAEAPKGMDWNAALKWAEKTGGSWRLPTPPEQALCYANVPELFKKEFYWSSKPCEGDAGYAWAQYFFSGHQSYYRKGDEFRVRVVRTVSIID